MKWVSATVLDNGLNAIKNGATRMLLISAYTASDSYATVVANELASAVVDSSDFTLSSSGIDRVLTVSAGTTATTTATDASPDLHVAFTDGAAVVYWVTKELTDQPITSGNTVVFPSFTYTSTQPV